MGGRRSEQIIFVMKSLFVVFFVLPLISYSQQDSNKQVIGKMYTTIGPGDYDVYVILHRNKQAIVTMQTSNDSLKKIFEFVESERKKLGNDVVAQYERITYQKTGNKKVELDVTPYNQKESGDKSNVTQEINKLKVLNFTTGTIYFSGYGFANVTAAKVIEKDKLETYYCRSGPGTTITLENIIYKNTDGSLSGPLNKSISLY